MVKPVFFKAQASSLIATAIDFALTIFLVEVIYVFEIVAGEFFAGKKLGV